MGDVPANANDIIINILRVLPQSGSLLMSGSLFSDVDLPVITLTIAQFSSRTKETNVAFFSI